MTELERIGRMLCAADGIDPDVPAWSLYGDYVKATLDAACILNAIPLDHEPDIGPAAAWRFTCTIPPKTERKTHAENSQPQTEEDR